MNYFDKYAIVFAGGGSKGAGQMGGWQAFQEKGIPSAEIVSGTSVGALNAALYSQNDFDKAQEVWKKIDEMILEISRRAIKKEVYGHYYRTEPMKRATYTISQRVREKWRKEQIVIWASQMIDGDRDWNEHCCYHIFLDCAIWLSENSKQEKAVKPDD